MDLIHCKLIFLALLCSFVACDTNALNCNNSNKYDKSYSSWDREFTFGEGRDLKQPSDPPPLHSQNHPAINKYLKSEGNTISSRLLVIDINNRKSNEFVKFERDNRKRRDIFTTVSPYLIYKVVNFDETLWRPVGSHFPYKVYVGDELNGHRKVRAHFPSDDETFQYSEIDEKPKLGSSMESLQLRRPSIQSFGHQLDYYSDDERYPSTKSPKLIDIDVRNRETTDKVEYEENFSNGTAVFTAMPGYLFSRVVKGNYVICESCGDRSFDRVVLFKDKHGNRKVECLYPGQHSHSIGHLPPPVKGHAHEPFAKIPPMKFQHPPTVPSERRFVSINLKELFSTKFIKYHYDNYKHIHSFSPIHPNVKINEVFKGSRLVWRHKHGDYPIEVLIIRDEHDKPIMRLEFPKVEDRSFLPDTQPQQTDKHVFKSKKDHTVSETTKVEPGTSKSIYDQSVKTMVPTSYNILDKSFDRKPIELVLDFSDTLAILNYPDLSYQNVSYTHVPQHKYLFSKVSIYRGLFGSRSVIWETKVPSKFSYKVERFGNEKIFIHLNNGTTLMFDFDDQGKLISNFINHVCDSKVTTPALYKPNLLEEAHVDKRTHYLDLKPIVLDISVESDSTFWTYSKKYNIATYTPKDNYIFRLVKHMSRNYIYYHDTIIWQTENNREFAYKVLYDHTSHIVVIYSVNSSVKLLKKIENKWIDYSFNHRIDNSNKKTTILYFDKENENIEYEYLPGGSTVIYRAKQGYAINGVYMFYSDVHSYRADRKIWSTEDPLYYVKKVIKTDYSLGEKSVTLTMFNELVLRFSRNHWGGKWEFTSSKVIRKSDSRLSQSTSSDTDDFRP